MISSQTITPRPFILLIKKSFAILCKKKVACKGGGVANALLLLPTKLSSGWRGPFADWGFSGGKQL